MGTRELIASSGKELRAPFQAIREREALRREAVRSSATSAVLAASSCEVPQATPSSPPVAVAENSQGYLVGWDAQEAVEVVKAAAPELFVQMVEERKDLLEALRVVGVPSMVFFMGLEAGPEIQAWFRNVKAAQALMGVEDTESTLQKMEEDAANDMLHPAVRSTMLAASKERLSTQKWMAEKLVGQMFGKASKEASAPTKIEIVVKRVSAPVQERVEDAIEVEVEE